jgi:hypothetical protein
MGVIPFLLALGAVPAVGSSISFTIDFTLTSGSPLPASGSFSYDASTGTFTGFDVVWDGDVFDLTSAANTSPYLPAYIEQPCILSGATTGPQEVFNLLTNCPTAYWAANDSSVSPTAPSFLIDVGVYDSVTSYGVDVISPGLPTAPPTTATGGFDATPAPEPGSCILMLIGLSLVMRRRISTVLRFSGRKSVQNSVVCRS